MSRMQKWRGSVGCLGQIENIQRQSLAIVYSLVDSCKALDVNPRECMEDILLRIPGNENNREALRELLPDKWAKQTSQNQLDPT